MNKEMLSQDYIDKICGGVYGKIIGVRLGIPFENHSSASLQREYDRIDSYPIYSDLTMPDDDNNGFVFFAKAFEMIGKPEHLSPEDAAYIILNYAWEKRGFFWWDKSTEFYGYLDRLHGMPCPEPGNGSDNVGGQIFYDAAGLVFAGQPEQAARCAEILSCVMHAGEGRIGAMFICACIARAFDSDDPEDIIETGLSLIPQDSEYAKMVRKVVAFHHKYPLDWKICQRMVEDNFNDWSAYGCAAHIIMALLYGCGCFTYSMEICLLSGGDTDCNCGNLGTILGAMLGWQGLSKDRWMDPINDTFFCSSALPYENDVSVTEVAASLIRACARFRNAALPEYLMKKPEMGSIRFLFPFSNQGFSVYNRTMRNAKQPSDVSLKNIMVCTDPNILPTPSGCPNVLKLWIDCAKKDQVYWLYRYSSDGLRYRKKAVFKEQDTEKPAYPFLAKYEPTCCSRYLPGQRIELSLFTKYNTCDMQISLIAYSSVCGHSCKSEPIRLQPWKWTKMTWTIPWVNRFIPDCIDIEIVPTSDTYFNEGYDGLDLYLDEIRIVGMPRYHFIPKQEMLESSKAYPMLSNFSVGVGDVYFSSNSLRFYSGKPISTVAIPQYQELADVKEMSAALFGCPLQNVDITCNMHISPPEDTDKEREWKMDTDGSSMMIVAAKGAADHYAVGFHMGKAGIYRCTGIPGEYSLLNGSDYAPNPYALYKFEVGMYGTHMSFCISQNGYQTEYSIEAADLYGYMGFVSLKNGITIYDFDIRPCKNI